VSHEVLHLRDEHHLVSWVRNYIYNTNNTATTAPPTSTTVRRNKKKKIMTITPAFVVAAVV